MLAIGWWTVLILRGVLPAIFAIVTGMLVAAVQNAGSVAGGGITQPLALVGTVFVLLQILTPIHTALSFNLGDRTAAWLYDRLTEACVRPPGMGHLEDPALTSDLTVARDFDLGMTGPPLSFSMDFIAGGMVEMVGGLAAAALLFGVRVVGADPARRRVALDAVAAPRERRLVRSQHARGARGAARRRVHLPAGGRSRTGQGAAAVRPRRLDDRALRRTPHAPARAAVRSDPAAREADGVEPADRARRQHRGVLVAGRRGQRRAHRARRGRRLRAGGDRRVAARVRRLQLGARRRRRAGGRGPAARGGDGAGRRAGERDPHRRRPAGARDPLPRRDVRLSRRRSPCSSTSI